MSFHTILQPPGWAEPRGYANGMLAEFRAGSRLVFVGGQVGWNAQGQFETDDFAGQAAQALRNVMAVLATGGAGPEHMVRMTWYVTDRDRYVASLSSLGVHYREIVGRHFPAMTAVEVSRLVESRALVEIEVTAVLPPPGESTPA